MQKTTFYIDEMEKGNLNNFDYKRIKTLEAELDEIHDKNKRGSDKIEVKMDRRGR